jgi:hypothetical protein
VNRGPQAVRGVLLTAKVTSLSGSVLYAYNFSLLSLHGNGVHTFSDPLLWPTSTSDSTNDTFLFFLDVRRDGDMTDDSSIGVSSPYWINNPTIDGQNYSQLGNLRHEPLLRASISVVQSPMDTKLGKQLQKAMTSKVVPEERRTVDDVRAALVTLSCAKESPSVCFMNRLSLLRPYTVIHQSDGEKDRRILPTYFSANYVTLLPGQSTSVMVVLPSYANDWKNGDNAVLLVEGWNVDTLEQDILLATMI